MSLSPQPGPSLVPHIERELRARLAELDAERATIRRALAALESPTVRPRRRRLAAATVLAAVDADPGVRASALALTLDRPVEAVTAQLQHLLAVRSVARVGLGWEATPADERGEGTGERCESSHEASLQT